MAKKKTTRQPNGKEAEPAKHEYPLRNKRRLETRAALIKSAEHLMSTRGFSDVTMQDVADHAGTHAQTLYAHFPNKYTLSAAAAVEALRVALAKREADTLTFWRYWLKLRSLEIVEKDSNNIFMGLVADAQTKPQFALVMMAISREYVDVLTQTLAEDFGVDPNVDLFPKLVAQMLMGASEHSILAWHEADGDFDLVAGQLSALDEVVNIVKLVRAARGVDVNAHSRRPA